MTFQITRFDNEYEVSKEFLLAVDYLEAKEAEEKENPACPTDFKVEDSPQPKAPPRQRLRRRNMEQFYDNFELMPYTRPRKRKRRWVEKVVEASELQKYSDPETTRLRSKKRKDVTRRPVKTETAKKVKKEEVLPSVLNELKEEEKNGQLNFNDSDDDDDAIVHDEAVVDDPEPVENGDDDDDDPWPMILDDLTHDPEIKAGDKISQELPYPPDAKKSHKIRKAVLQRQRDDERNPKFKNPGRKLPLSERQV